MFEFIQKQYPENFVLKNLKQATFSHILLFLRVGKQTFHIISGAHNAKSKCCYDAKPSAYYFQVKTKISVDFQICISLSLSEVSFLEEQLQTFAFAKLTFGTTTFSKELLFQSTHSLNFLLWNCSFQEQLLLRGSI